MMKEEVESLEANQGNCVLAGFPPGFSQSGVVTLLTMLDLSNASSDSRLLRSISSFASSSFRIFVDKRR
jgi:hypothetical protein